MEKDLKPVTDEELKDIIKEVIDAYDKNFAETPEKELAPEVVEILNAETMEERAKLLEKYGMNYLE